MGNSGDRGWCFIYFAVLTTSLTAFATGSCFVWTSPFLPKFLSLDPEVSPIGRPVTTSESAWIVSAMSLGLIFGPAVSMSSLKYCTKKTVLLISMAPLLIAHVICCFSINTYSFIFARFLMGIGTGATWAVLGTYIAEISEDKNRGFLGCTPGILSNLGSLLVYIIGPYLNVTLFSISMLIPLIVFYVGFGFFIPDSPYDLIIKGRYDAAKISLKNLRRVTNVEKEIAFIQETIKSGNNEKVNFRDLVKDRVLRKGLLICVALMLFQQLSGILAVVSYAEVIFKLAGDFIPSAISAMVLGVVGTTGNIVSLFMVDKMGRKLLLTGSCILEAISLFALGLYFNLLNSNIDVSAISWLPIVSLIVFMVAFNLALGMVPWIVMGELFHSSVKDLASTITAVTNFMFSFIVTICFPYMAESLGMGWTFWIFAVIMIFGSIFCVTVMPETKGRNFQEIQKMLNKK